MAQVLEIPDQIYTALEEAAAENDTTPVDWIASHLPVRPRSQKTSPSLDAPKTLADLFAGRVGTVHSGGKERLSEDCGEKFTTYLESKRQAGRL
jgi:hypothetical protein